MTRDVFIAHVEHEQEALRSFLLALCCVSTTAADDSFEHQDLYLALRILPPKERSSITLYYLSGYNIKEISAITETSEDAVKKQLSRGRDKLKEILKL